jgi:hypothetical protein
MEKGGDDDGQSRAEHPAPDFTLPDLNGKSHFAFGLSEQEELPGSLQPRIFLTVLPPAHGAVAPRPSALCGTGHGILVVGPEDPGVFPEILGEENLRLSGCPIPPYRPEA